MPGNQEMFYFSPSDMSVLGSSGMDKLGSPEREKFSDSIWTVTSGGLERGINIQEDPKLGKVVFLGEIGRGRRYEKVSLDRSNPPKIEGDRVLRASAKKITIKAKDGKPEHSFYVLEKPKNENKDSAILIRLNTEGTYTRNTYGSWEKLEGSPEDLISGYGAYGDAGRLGSWNDGLVIMRPGDALKVTFSGGHKLEPMVVFYDTDSKAPEYMSLQDFEVKRALEASQLEEKPETKIIHGRMPLVTFSQGEFKPGVDVTQSAEGTVFELGEEDTRGHVHRYAVVGFNPENGIKRTAITKQGETVVLDTRREVEKAEGQIMIHIKNGNILTGNPAKALEVYSSHSRRGSDVVTYDQIWVLKDGDTVQVGTDWVVEMTQGKLNAFDVSDWHLREAGKNSAAYQKDGWSRTDNIPQDWVGKVVSCYKKNRSDQTVYARGVLKSVSSPTFDFTWEELDPDPSGGSTGLMEGTKWIRLLKDIDPNSGKEDLTVTESIRFRDPPIPENTPVMVHVDTVGEEQSYTGSIRKTFIMSAKGVEADVYEVTSWNQGGSHKTSEKRIGTRTVPHTWVVVDASPLGEELHGEFPLTCRIGKRQTSWAIDTSGYTDDQLEAMEGQNKEMETAANVLWGFIVAHTEYNPRFKYQGEDYQISKNPNSNNPEFASLYQGFIDRYHGYPTMDAFKTGLLEAWAKDAGATDEIVLEAGEAGRKERERYLREDMAEIFRQRRETRAQERAQIKQIKK